MSEDEGLKKLSEVDKILAKLKYISCKLGGKDMEPGMQFKMIYQNLILDLFRMSLRSLRQS